jgi:hypothetical protein
MRPDFFVDMGPDASLTSLACPTCRNTETRVLSYSEHPSVRHWFCRCIVCSHVWTIDKKPRQLDLRSVSAWKSSKQHARARDSH